MLNTTPKIIKSYNLNPLEKIIKTDNQDTLIIFDIGNVILRRPDNFFNWVNADKSNIILKKYIFDRYKVYATQNKINPELSDTEKSIIWVNIKNKANKIITSPEILSLINKIQEKNIPVIALTLIDTGIQETKEDIEHDRINDLLKLGINFSKAFNINLLNLTNINNPDSKPVFKNGILFADKAPKGETLKLFLEKLNLNPKKIIFIDDSIEYINSVAKTSQELNINFIGIHYLIKETFYVNQNIELNNKQLDYFFKHQIWLNDETFLS
jgi:FMN phosphatase YigB (HAD superfamily)